MGIVNLDGMPGPDWHESSAGSENCIDRAETAKTFACKAGYDTTSPA